MYVHPKLRLDAIFDIDIRYWKRRGPCGVMSVLLFCGLVYGISTINWSFFSPSQLYIDVWLVIWTMWCCRFTVSFLLNNYHQALDLLQTKPAVLVALEKLGGTDTTVVEGWLCEITFTDCQRNPSRRHGRWSITLQWWNFVIASKSFST